MKKIILTTLSIILLASAGTLRAENIGVPAECEDVMLQAFYWDSYKTPSNLKYGSTTWTYLTKDSLAIRENFDLVWLPPSAKSKGGVGYYHYQLSDQGSQWGRKDLLQKLIASLHRGGTKVLADIVINHRGDKDWCDFEKDVFGEGYGTFQLETKHICYGDECFYDTDSKCYNGQVRGNADTGTNDGGCRDLDHSNEYVQEWAKAYVRWMREVMKYDGFRYDMTRGYAGKYLQMYNEAAQPYLSVSEFWTGIDDIVTHLASTGYNTMAFDFPLKYLIKEAFSANNYGRLKKNTNSLRGKNLSRYAVTFIDNHDTFERAEEDACNQEFIGCKVNLDDASVKDKILQANAYILMMPGVPCVFYPHWAKYKEAINALISVRKMAGIHSESVVSDEKGGTTTKYYSGRIQGHRGSVELRLGPKRSTEVPEGYRLALDGAQYGSDFTIYVSDDTPTGVKEVNARIQTEKFIKNGVLYIRHGEKVYDMMGRTVEQ